MKILSPFQRTFVHAAGHQTLRLFNENAAKITGVVFGASDAFLSSLNYLKNDTFHINLPVPTPDQLLSMSGMAYLSSSIFFLGADRLPVLKKPIGALALLGGVFAAAAGYGAGTPELYGTAIAPIMTGLSMMFENSANKMAEQFADTKTKLASAARLYLKYPIATMAMLQTGSAGFALAAGLRDPEQRFLIPYALMWAAGNVTMALTDNNVKEMVRKIYTPKEAPPEPAQP